MLIEDFISRIVSVNEEFVNEFSKVSNQSGNIDIIEAATEEYKSKGDTYNYEEENIIKKYSIQVEKILKDFREKTNKDDCELLIHAQHRILLNQ